MIPSNSRLVGLIGWPVSHSRSPHMHNTTFAALGLDWAYVPLPVPPGRVQEAVAGLAARGFAGANVTLPHKQTVIPYLHRLTAEAQAVGAVNTITVGDDGLLTGDTTDGHGFVRDLADNAVETPRHALVLGSGGAARSIVHALAHSGSTVTVCARNFEKAEAVCAAAAKALPPGVGPVRAAPFPAGLSQVAADASLIVNATSLGLHEEDPLPWDRGVRFRPDQVVYDLTYHRETELLKLATEQGARAIGGLGMLVHQGARSFELWTGVAAPVDVMMAAAAEAG